MEEAQFIAALSRAVKVVTDDDVSFLGIAQDAGCLIVGRVASD